MENAPSHDFDKEAAQAAGRFMESNSPEEAEQSLPSLDELTYDEAVERVQAMEDLGVDPAFAWNREDPTGAIRATHEQHQETNHRATVRRAIDEMQQTIYEAQVAEAQQIPQPRIRDSELIRLKALKVARESRRGRRA